MAINSRNIPTNSQSDRRKNFTHLFVKNVSFLFQKAWKTSRISKTANDSGMFTDCDECIRGLQKIRKTNGGCCTT